jgi:exopolysaccharide biosynthesis protein
MNSIFLLVEEYDNEYICPSLTSVENVLYLTNIVTFEHKYSDTTAISDKKLTVLSRYMNN